MRTLEEWMYNRFFYGFDTKLFFREKWLNKKRRQRVKRIPRAQHNEQISGVQC